MEAATATTEATVAEKEAVAAAENTGATTKHTKTNSILAHSLIRAQDAWTDLQQRAIFEDQLYANNKSVTRLDHVLDGIIAGGKYARKPGLEGRLDWIIRQGGERDDEDVSLDFVEVMGENVC